MQERLQITSDGLQRHFTALQRQVQLLDVQSVGLRSVIKVGHSGAKPVAIVGSAVNQGNILSGSTTVFAQ